MAKINSKIDKALRKEVIENGVFLGHIASFGFNCNVYLYENEVYRENFTMNDDFIITDFARWTWYMVKNNITQFHPNEPYAEELIEYMTLYENSLYLSNKKYREIAKEQFVELKKDYQESGLLDDINALLKKSKSKTFRYSKYEGEKNVGKSLREDSLDDIIPMGHSEYFDTLVEFLKDNDVPIKISHTINGGKICYVENDMEFITVIFKSPKRGYELLKMIEMYGDGRTYLSKGKGGAWNSNYVPLEEVYIWDIDEDEFVNYKGKVLKNIDYNDIVESKNSARKSLKEAEYYPTLNRGKGYDVLSWILLDIAEWGEKVIHRDCAIEDGHNGIIFRGRLYEYYILKQNTEDLTSWETKFYAWDDLCNDYMESGFHDKGTPIEIQQLLHKKELWELVEVANWFIGKQNIIELRPTRELVNWAERNYNYV